MTKKNQKQIKRKPEEREHVSVLIKRGEEMRVLMELRIAMRDKKTSTIMNSREVVVKCLNIVFGQMQKKR